jgi:SAM-dependent methyltransferase
MNGRIALGPVLPSYNSPIDADSDDLASVRNGHPSDTQSLSASITDYPVHWGRRYHRYREGAYPFPNDDYESERLDNQHDICTEYFNGRLFFAPLDTKACRQVLDIGTGTGIWPIQLAESNQLPSAQITGIDLSAIQPELVPKNVTFEIQDCTDTDWCRERGTIDYIHSRFMAGSLASWKRLLRTSRRHLKPGDGWLELHEIHPTPLSDDSTMPATWKFLEWEELIHQTARKKLNPPKSTRVAEHLKPWMEESGFIDVDQFIYKIPLGPWARDKKLKKIGADMCSNWASGLQGFSYKILGDEGLGWSRDEIELNLVDVRKSLAMKEVHCYVRYYVVIGRRPSATEERELREEMDHET